MKITVCFDIDGTILDEFFWFRERWTKVWEKYSPVLGTGDITGRFWSIFNTKGPKYRYHLDELISEFPEVGPIKLSIIKDFKEQEIGEKIMHNAVEALNELADDNTFLLSVISNGNYPVQVSRLGRAGLLKYFDLIICDECFLKPNAKMFSQIKFHSPSDKYFYIGNEPDVDFEGAKSVNFNTIMVGPEPVPQSNNWIDIKLDTLKSLKNTINESIQR